MALNIAYHNATNAKTWDGVASKLGKVPGLD